MGIRLWRYGLWFETRARAPSTCAPCGDWALWGTSAAAALTLAVVAGYSDTGSRRLMAAAAPPGGTTVAQRAPAAATPQPVARSSETEAETRRLAEAVRALTADRERLAARLGTLERSLEDVTGAIKQQATAAAARPRASDRAAFAERCAGLRASQRGGPHAGSGGEPSCPAAGRHAPG